MITLPFDGGQEVHFIVPLMEWRKCSKCDGTGSKEGKRCSGCLGYGMSIDGSWCTVQSLPTGDWGLFFGPVLEYHIVQSGCTVRIGHSTLSGSPLPYGGIETCVSGHRKYTVPLEDVFGSLEEAEAAIAERKEEHE